MSFKLTDFITVSNTGVTTFGSDGILINRTGADAYLFFQKSGTNRGAIYGGDASDSNGLRFFIGNNSDPSLSIDSNGSVGIGTTSPNAKLKVEGNAATNGLSIKSGGNGSTYPFMVTWASGTEGDVFCINDSLNVGIGTASPNSYFVRGGGLVVDSVDAGSNIVILNDNNTFSSLFFAKGSTGAEKYQGYIEYEHANNAMAFGTAQVERMHITSDGKVGIGTASPFNNLQVKQTGDSGNNYLEGVIQVGGGSAVLGAALSYSAIGSGRLNLSSLNDGGGTNALISLGFGAITSGTPANTVMTLNQSGNVGIGVTPIDAHQIGKTSGNLQLRIGTSTTSISPLVRFQGQTSSSVNRFADIQLDTVNDLLSFFPPSQFANVSSALDISSAGTATFNGNISITEMATIVVSDISTGENRGLKLENTGASGKTWNITPGLTGVNNSNFTIRNATDNVNVLIIASDGVATFSTLGSFGSGSGSKLNVGSDSNGAFLEATNNKKFRILTGGTDSLAISSGGVVTINTTESGTEKLQLQGGIKVWYDSNFNRSSALGYDGLYNTGQNGYLWTSTAHDWIIGTNNIQRMRILSGGDVGIGHNGYSGYRLSTRGVDSTSSNFAFFAENSGTYGLFSVRNDGYITFNNIGSTSPYQYAVSGRDAILNSSGEIGTSASIRKAKINIENETDVSWLYNLNPVKFNYRKKDEKLNYLNEAEEEQRHGLIAEEVEEVNTDFCWYNVNEEGDKDLAGVDYKMLITPMLKAIQEQQTIIESQKSLIDSLTTRIEALED